MILTRFCIFCDIQKFYNFSYVLFWNSIIITAIIITAFILQTNKVVSIFMKRNNVAFTLENGERKMIQCSDCGIECKSIEMETVSNDD